MKKILSVVIAVGIIGVAFGQEKKKEDWSKVVIDRAGDHFMIQGSWDNWSSRPDSIKNLQHGFSRGINVAIMMNKPFKSDPRWSAAFGIGISNSNIFFKKAAVDVKANTVKLPFTNLADTNHFKKYKLANTYAEVPIELRYTFDPVNQKKSYKIAMGVKVGYMINAHNKGKTLQNKKDITINDYIQKENEKTFFNNARLVGTARFGIGNFSLFGAYSITALIKDVAGPAIKPYQLGICISGL
jgi:hypothetical protein